MEDISLRGHTGVMDPEGVNYWVATVATGGEIPKETVKAISRVCFLYMLKPFKQQFFHMDWPTL